MRCTGGGIKRRTISRSQCPASSHRVLPWNRNAGEVNYSTINLLILKYSSLQVSHSAGP